MSLELLSRIQFGPDDRISLLFPPITIGLGLLLVSWRGCTSKPATPSHEMTGSGRISACCSHWGRRPDRYGVSIRNQLGRLSRFVATCSGALWPRGFSLSFLNPDFWPYCSSMGQRSSLGRTCRHTHGRSGAHFSAIWIIVANSWQQTPAGHHIVGSGYGTAEIVDFWQVYSIRRFWIVSAIPSWAPGRRPLSLC